MKDQMINRGLLFSLVTVLVMLFALHGTTYAETVLSIDPAEIESPAAGESLTVSVNITGGTGIKGYGIDVMFDPTALSFVGVQVGDFLPGAIIPVAPTAATDANTGLATVSIAGVSFSGEGSDMGTVVTLSFNVVEAKNSSIQLANIQIPDPADASLQTLLAVTTADGAITVPAPEMPETPETPEMPETPETPEMPETPETPEMPETPETPEMPETPETPEMPETPETPEMPETPETPEMPETPETPEMPETPETPEMPETPETPEMPETPETPEMPETPETPEMPETPETPEMPETPEPPRMASFSMMLDAGLNMISLPLMPAEPYTAQSFADAVGATIVIKLDAASQKFVGFTAGEGGDGFAIEGGKGYIVNTPDGGSVTFTGMAWDNQQAATAPSINPFSDAWAFVVSGNLQKADPHTNYILVAKNLRTGAVATDPISKGKVRSAAVWADLNRNSVIQAGDQLEITVIDDGGHIVSGPFTHTVDIADIKQAFLRLSLVVGDVPPEQTLLAQNFPNPFNPETWMPFQLSESSAASIQIYSTSGQLVRTLDLGLMPAGFYMTQSSAAYWDGRNSTGEHVASGVYFYTLKTDNFAATRKMLISK